MKLIDPQKLPIKGINWERILPEIVKANRSLAIYGGILYGVPNPNILLSPLTTQEAVLSSRIEGTEASLSEVLKYEAGEDILEESKRLDIQEIVNYRRALNAAEQKLQNRPFNLNLLLELHEILLSSVRGENKGKGRFRTIQNWIGTPGAPIEQAQYIPPDPMKLREYMDNWEKYYHMDENDNLVQIAIVHAQFEIIHPFIDGNGRMGRILIPLFLYEKGLLSRPVFYISEYLEGHRNEYIELLRRLNGINSWNKWILFFLKAVSEQASRNTEKARNILNLYQELKNDILELTRSHYAVPLLDRFFDMPVFTARDILNAPAMPSRQMTITILKTLHRAGILKIIRESSGRKPQIYALARLVNLCEGREVM